MAKLTSKGTYAVSDWSNVDALFPKTRMGTGAEDSDVTYQNDAYTQFKNLESGYWLQFLPQLGFTGPTTKEVVNSPGTENEQRTTTISDEAAAAIQQFKAQGYDVVINPNKIDSGKKSATEFAFKTPDGKFQKTWEYTGGAWYEQVAPYLGLVLPGILGMAGITAGSLGASITGQTSNTLLNNAVGGAIIGGAKELITSGGDVESAIKGALTGGALGAAAELAQPYIKDAANALSRLTGDEVAQLAGTDAAATDVAGDVGSVDVGGGAPFIGDELLSPTNLDNAYASLSDYGRTVYDAEISLGTTPDTALIRAYKADALNFPTTGNALATGGAEATGNALATDQNALAGNALASAQDQFNFAGFTGPQFARYDDLVSSGLPPEIARAQVLQEFGALDVGAVTGGATTGAVTPPGGVATVDLTAAQTAGQTAGAGTVADAGANLGAAGTAAGVVGAGAAGAGVAGTGTAGGGLTVPPGAGLGNAGAITTPGGLDSTVAGGGGITAGTTGGAGLDTSGLVLGGALGAGAAAGSALPVGSAAAAGSALGAGTAAGAAAGLTGIPVVDDFLKYIGTPAGAAALGAFGSLAGGYLTGQAAKDAAQIQAQSAANALKLQEDQFEYQKSLLEPYRARGESALNRLAGVMGLDGQAAQPQQLLEMDPGYAFRLGEGMKALERVQAARGNMLSGGAIKAGQRYAQDFASGEYGNAYNRLANIAGLGQTVGGQLGSAAQQFGQTAGETMSQGANALAAGRIGRTSGYMSGIGGAVGAYQNYQNQQQQNQLFRDIYGRMGG
jgi:hypothetical protein